MSKFIQFSVFILAGIVLFGCKKDDGPTLEDQIRVAIQQDTVQHAIDVQKIKDYLSNNNFTAQSTSSGLHFLVEQEGTGGNPKQSSTVTVFYKGYLPNGQVFDQTGANPISFPLNQVILGWREGIPLFKKGGKGKLFIPSALAYGNRPLPGIPANSVLIFEVELVNF